MTVRMKKTVVACILLCVSFCFIACMANPSVLLTFSEGTLDKIEYDTMLKAQFKPDNIMKNHGFELYIKFYFTDDKLTACDHVYKFKTKEKAEKWYNKYEEALNATPGCYIDETSVIKNETSPSLEGKSMEEIKSLIEYNFNYMGSEVITADR